MRSAVRRSGGRPTQNEAAQLGERIVAAATQLFLERGFGATSVEAVTEACGISKRTFYHRFRDKPDLFRAVVRGLVDRWMRPLATETAEAGPIEETLERTGRQFLAAALSPVALNLYRILVAEAPRFPELALILNESAAAGLDRIAGLIGREVAAGRLVVDDPRFAAEQFANLVVAGPRRRALGLGAPLSEPELALWTRRSVALFLAGCRADARTS
jgi:AcrR family transcriptional regulator